MGTRLLSPAMNDGIGKFPSKTARKFWLSRKHEEQSSPSLPLFCYYSNLKSVLFCCFVIDVYNGLLKSRVTNARMVHVTFVRPDCDSMNGGALI